LNDYDLEQLGLKLQNLCALQALDLTFDMNYDLSDKSFVMLLNGISKPKSLETLSLSIEKNKNVSLLTNLSCL